MTDTAIPPAPPPHRRRHRIMERLRSYFIAGVLVTGPIALTLYLTWALIRFIDDSVGSLLPKEYNPATYVPIPGLGLVVVVVGLTFVGAVAAGYVGRVLVIISERIVERMPVVRSIHGGLKQIFETVLASKSNTFREVVMVEWPRAGMWTIAFVTVRPDGEIREQVGPDAVAVYVPTTPNPTGGYLVFLRRRDIVTLPMTVEEGIKYIISGGIVAPPARPAAIAEAPTPEIAEASK